MRSVYKDFDNPPKELAEHGWQHPKVKEALYEIYQGKCAYSEVRLSFEEAVIDHYRPIAIYPDLENEWSNLILVSNSITKSKREKIKKEKDKNRENINPEEVVFKIQNERCLKINDKNRKANSYELLSETPLLLHPEIDRLENHLSFSKDGIIQSKTERGFYTIDICDLNNLIISRKKQIDRITKSVSEICNQHLNHMDYNKTKESLFSILNDIKNRSSADKHYSFLYLNIFYNFTNWFLVEQAPEGMNGIIYKAYNEFVYPQIFIKVKEDNSDKPVSSLADAIDKMPLTLISHKVENFQRIRSLEIKNLPVNTQWIFLTGENGHGKTSLLQSITVSLYGLRGNNLSEDYSESFFQSLLLNNQLYMENFLGMEFGFKQINSFAAYGANRLELSDNFYIEPNNKFNKLDSIFGFKEGKPQNIEEYLISIRNKNKSRYSAIISIFKNLIDGLEDIIVDDSTSKDKVFYIEKDKENHTLQEIEFSKLATGYKCIIAMIGDMIIQLGDQAKVISIEGKDTLDIEGIVIIDEIDAHLHPKYQKLFVSKLTELFPKVQFIASTHSPIPLLGAPYNTVILNVTRESAKDGIKVERLDDKIDFKRLTPEALLTSPIFGFRDIISDALGEDYKLLETESDFERITENNKIKEELRNLNPEQIEKLKKVFTG